MQKRIKKRFDLNITEPDAIQSQTFELDKTVVALHGLVFTADRDDFLYYRGAAKVEINRQEIFPENYECKLLMTGINVSPNDRYYNLGGIEPGNGKIKVDYKDTNASNTIYESYRVSIYLDCEINEQA